MYCSSSVSLAVLECLVHFEWSEAPTDYVAIPVDIPETVLREDLSPGDLPPDWRQFPAPASTQAIGRRWIQSGRAALLQVPSVLVPSESNMLLNPSHGDVSRLRVLEAIPFDFDPRLIRR